MFKKYNKKVEIVEGYRQVQSLSSLSFIAVNKWQQRSPPLEGQGPQVIPYNVVTGQPRRPRMSCTQYPITAPLNGHCA